jgi:thiol-disulfide isomerase/thioredoxin
MSIGFFQPSLEQAPTITSNTSTEIAFKDGNGKIIRLSELKGKVVFINFWATWCPPCRAEMPSISKLSDGLKENKNVVFLMVDVDSDYKKARKFMDNKNFALPLYIPASSIPETLLDGTIPTTLIFDKEGNLVVKHIGAGNFSSQKVREYLTKLSQ